jgi:hypothetical protein
MTSDKVSTCICGAAFPPGDARAIASFTEVRKICPALHKVLLPDSIWQEFLELCNHPDDIAGHRSVLLLAYLRGCLGRVTSPVHRYLLASGTVRSDARRQYINDLQEKWLFKQQPLERHRKWRIFQGHLVELLFAAWLEEQSYAITGLEALREGADIEAVSPGGLRSAFEVKFIGSEDADFEMQVKSIAGEPSAGCVSPQAAINYLTFRVYEAAKQLQKATLNRTAILIVDDMAWWRFDLPVKRKWIDWTHPQFVGRDERWEMFITRQQRNHPGLPDDLAETIRAIDSIWIVGQSSEFRFCRKYDIRSREGDL